MSAPAGWYPDALDPSRQRWWDGEQWTDLFTPGAAVQVPTSLAAPLERPRRKGLSTTAKVLTSVVSGVSFITGVIAVLPIVFRDASSVQALTVEVNAYPATATEWALPATSELTGFPSGEGDVCTPDQAAWLEDHAEPIVTHVIVEMRNRASEGAMLTVKDFAFTGERTSGAKRSLRVVCDTSPQDSIRAQPARLDATVDGGVAVFSASTFGARTEGLPDTPAAWNLAPGETGRMLVRVYGGSAAVGGLGATVLAGTESTALSPDENAVEIIVLPLIDDGLRYLRAGEGLRCIDERTDESADCTVEELLAASTAGG